LSNKVFVLYIIAIFVILVFTSDCTTSSPLDERDNLTVSVTHNLNIEPLNILYPNTGIYKHNIGISVHNKQNILKHNVNVILHVQAVSSWCESRNKTSFFSTLNPNETVNDKFDFTTQLDCSYTFTYAAFSYG
jgi:hypothetical protein